MDEFYKSNQTEQIKDCENFVKDPLNTTLTEKERSKLACSIKLPITARRNKRNLENKTGKKYKNEAYEYRFESTKSRLKAKLAYRSHYDSAHTARSDNEAGSRLREDN